MERFQDRTVIVELRQGGVEGDEEPIVDTRVAHIVADGSDKESQTIEWVQ